MARVMAIAAVAEKAREDAAKTTGQTQTQGDAKVSANLPEVTVTQKSWLKRAWGTVKDGASSAWDWAKGINFHFSMEGEVTFGSQIGAGVELFGSELGFEANAGSAQYLAAKVEVTQDNGEVSGNYYNKNGEIAMKHGASLGLGIVSLGVENEYKLNSPTPNQTVKVEASAGVEAFNVSAEHVFPIGPQSEKPKNTSGLHLQSGAKVKLLIGLEFKVRLGVSHD
jgi:hypothetical protein